jgi:hypothetical protein
MSETCRISRTGVISRRTIDSNLQAKLVDLLCEPINPRWKLFVVNQDSAGCWVTTGAASDGPAIVYIYVFITYVLSCINSLASTDCDREDYFES